MQIATGGSAGPAGGTFTCTAAATGRLVVFSCGCTAQAGENQLLSGGAFSIPVSTIATPPSPNPVYTSVPGRNYLIVATQNGGGTTEGNGPESWTLQFLGNVPAHNLGLGAGGATTSDVFTAVGALYVYANSENGDATAFDDWNLNTVLAWVTHMRTAPNASEQTLLNDIAAAQESGKTLFSSAPPWYPSLTGNSTIQADVTAVAASGDSTLPTPCPGGSGGCTGAPQP